MLWLGDWQFHRAESGNALSWAYTFEWPIFAIIRAGLLGEDHPRRVQAARRPGHAVDVELPAAVTAPPGTVPASVARLAAMCDEADDPELAAYNAYLARLNEQVKGHGRWHGLR